MKRVFVLWLLAVLAAAAAGSAVAQVGKKGKDGQNRWVFVVNHRSSDMLRLYASRAASEDWEGNWLARPIAAGTQLPIDFDDGTGACVFDFRAIFRDNLVVHMWKINVCREEFWVIVD